MSEASLRPGEVCRELLNALDASDGRRKRRHRDTTPDAIGMALKRELLERAARDDPEPERFESWLLEQCLGLGASGGLGAPRAMALEIAAEWRLAAESPSFRAWLEGGAPSDDARVDG